MNSLRCQDCKYYMSNSQSIFDPQGCKFYPNALLYPYSINIYCKYSAPIKGKNNDTNTTTR